MSAAGVIAPPPRQSIDAELRPSARERGAARQFRDCIKLASGVTFGLKVRRLLNGFDAVPGTSRDGVFICEVGFGSRSRSAFVFNEGVFAQTNRQSVVFASVAPNPRERHRIILRQRADRHYGRHRASARQGARRTDLEVQVAKRDFRKILDRIETVNKPNRRIGRAASSNKM